MTKIESLKEKNELLRKALQDLVDKLDLLAKDEQFQGVFVLYNVHGGYYTGPNWVVEFEAAKKVLSDL
jgi:hypothetical protein